MYNGNIDSRSNAPLKCMVPLQDRDEVVQWVMEQDSQKLSDTHLGDMLMLSIPGCSFLILKGQHCHRAYVEVFKEQASGSKTIGSFSFFPLYHFVFINIHDKALE